MKVLCYQLSHDSSWMYYDSETKELYFFSAEREYNCKNATIRECDPIKIAQTKFGFDKKNPEHILIGWTHKYEPFVDKIKAECDKDKLWKQIKFNQFTIDHHFAHILSSVALDNSINEGISIDGKGDRKRRVMIVKNLHDLFNLEFIVPQNNPPIGKLFSLFTEHLNWKTYSNTCCDNIIEYQRNVGKIMGLQSYGKIDNNFNDKLNNIPFTDNNIDDFDELFKNELQDIDLYNTNCNFDKITTYYQFLCNKVLNVFDSYMNKNNKIAYAGGVALSTVANDLLIQNGYNITICPAANDMGLVIGMMKFADIYYNLNIDFKDLKYLYYNDLPIVDIPDNNIKLAAKLLSQNEIIAFVHGAAEVGPRALGHRSILMNPSIDNGKDFINDRVKHREWWRPFGGSTIDTSIIENYKPSDLDFYMLKNYTLKTEWKNNLQSICHKDNSCRLQIVTDSTEPLYKVINSFKELTNIPAVLNTSFNIAGRPIPNYKKHIMETFKTLDGIIYMFYNDKVYKKVGLSKYGGAIEIKELSEEEIYGALQK